MPTVINNPTTTDSDSSGINWVVALVLIIALFFLLFYGLPALRGGGGTFLSVPRTSAPQEQTNPQSGSESRIEVNAPAVDVPEEVNINTPNNPNQ